MGRPLNYPHILRPLSVGNHTILRNRMIASSSKPNCVQGPEKYPGPGYITHYANKAKNGASVVTVTVINPSPNTNTHTVSFDFRDPLCQNYICQLTDAVHTYGSLASVFLFPDLDKGYDVSIGIPNDGKGIPGADKQFTEKMLREMAEAYADQAALMQSLGFDMAYLHMAYRGLPIARFLSPLTNLRTDDFGGSLENRARFPLMVCDRIKQKCGKDFLLEVSLSGEDPGTGGITLDETADFIRLGAGHFDMVQIRAPYLGPAHPTGYTKEHIPFLYMAEKIKKSGVPMPVGTIAGCFYPEDCEALLAEGKADYVAMARSWISNPNYGELVTEGRGEDIIPCIRCNKCHRAAPNAPWITVCSVNPLFGLEHQADKLVSPVKRLKEIAVVGGGPAGMKAALVCTERGHKVTLFEKTGVLGGQLIAASTPSFKWPLWDYKDYLIRQIGKSPVEVRLNTEAVPELLKDFDEVISAVGAAPIIPPIPGVTGANVTSAVQVYGHEAELGRRVAVIGGGEIGAETGMHLAELGHEVTVLELRDELAADAAPSMFRSMMMDYAQSTEGFHWKLGANVTEITKQGVAYQQGGDTHHLEVDSVVLSVGSLGLSVQAAALYNDGQRVIMVGDCVKAGNLQQAIRTAYAAASNL